MLQRRYERAVRAAAAAIRRLAPGFVPDVAVILGSGLAGSAPELRGAREIPYARIPGFPRPTVKGHQGKLIIGERPRSGGGLKVAVLSGRFHYYEGHPMESIALPVRALRELGLKTLIVTSAVGSMRRALRPGSICVVRDHMNFIGANPLRAFHQEAFGEMFPDLSGAYTPELRRLALAECRRGGIPAREGVYTAVCGPSYETPAEIRAFARLGGDIVGMSVVPEVIPARQLGLRILALSWVANMAAGIIRETLTHGDVLALGRRMTPRLKSLLGGILDRI